MKGRNTAPQQQQTNLQGTVGRRQAPWVLAGAGSSPAALDLAEILQLDANDRPCTLVFRLSSARGNRATAGGCTLSRRRE
jgi:hypothetical protein